MDFPKSISDFFDAVLSPVKDRLVTPIKSAFFASWLLFNWEVLYFFIRADGAPSEKISIIKNDMTGWQDGFWLPLLVASLFCITYPAIRNFGNMLWSLSDNNSGRITDTILKKANRLTLEDQEKLLVLMEERARAHQEEMSEKDSEVKELKNLVSKLNVAKSRNETTSDENSISSDSNFINFSSNELTSLLRMTEGHHQTKKYIASKLLMDIDELAHKNEITSAEKIIEHVCKEHPEGWIITDIKTPNQNLSVGAVKGVVIKIAHVGLIEIVAKGEREKVYLTVETLRFFSELKRNLS